MRPRLPKGGSLAHRIFPPRTPVFTRAQDRVLQRSLSGVGVSRYTLPLIAAPLAVVELCRAHGTRLPQAGSKPGALPRAVGASTLVRISGSGAGVPDSPSYLSAGNRRWQFLSCALVKWGTGGKHAKDLGHSAGSPTKAKRPLWGEDEQGNGRSFRRQAETK